MVLPQGWSVDFGGWGGAVDGRGRRRVWGAWVGQSSPCASPSQEGRTEEQGLEQLSSARTDKG